MRKCWIKFWAFVYRRTGHFSLFARLEEYRALVKEFKVFDRCEGADIFVGSWQAHYGFFRKIKIPQSWHEQPDDQQFPNHDGKAKKSPPDTSEQTETTP